MKRLAKPDQHTRTSDWLGMVEVLGYLKQLVMKSSSQYMPDELNRVSLTITCGGYFRFVCSHCREMQTLHSPPQTA